MIIIRWIKTAQFFDKFQMDSKLEAASAYVDAAICYKKTSPIRESLCSLSMTLSILWKLL